MEFKVQDCVTKQVYADLHEIATAPLDFAMLRNATVLITGAAGFIGYYLTAALLLRNDLYGDDIRVLALVRNRDRAEEKFGELQFRDDLRFCVQDVTSPIHAPRADYIIHAASQASNIQFETDPVGTINANLTGTANVLGFARECRAKATLVVSSLKVYGTVYGAQEKLTEEDNGYIDFTSYRNCYAMGKRASETLAASFCREYGVHVKLARPAYIFGASSLNDDRVWAQFLANAVRGEDILLKSNGAAKRSFCYVTDTAAALLTILLAGKDAQPYNIAFEASDTTIRGFAAAVCAAFPERHLQLRFADPADAAEPEAPVTPLRQVPEILDSGKLRALGWQPKVDLAEGIRRSVRTLEERR